MASLVLPLALAAAAATCFAGAAVVQQEAVRTVVGAGEDRLSPARLMALVRRPRWLAGTALAGAGAGLHAGALSMAPLSVVQPVGVLAVPVAVALVFTATHRRPPAGVVVGTGLTVAGVTAFVLLATGPGGGSPQVGTALVVAALVVAVVVAGLAALALPRHGRLRSAGCAAAAATAFGLVSLLLRTVLTEVTSGRLSLLDPAALALLAGMVLAAGVGGWLSQQALASGAAAVSLAVLTLLDPVVAVTLGAVLGDGAPSAWLWPALAVLPAVAGVVVLSRFHPAATEAGATSVRPRRPGSQPRAGRDAPGAAAVDDTPHRVVIGTDTYPPDVNGAARFASSLAAGLAQRGHEVHVVAPSVTGAPGVEQVGGVTVHRLRSHPFPGRPELLVCLPWQVRSAAAGVVADVRPDVVHVQSHFPVGRSVAGAAHRAGVAVVATNHVVPENFLARVPRLLRPAVAAWFWADMIHLLRRAEVVTAPTPRAVAMLAGAGLPNAVPISNGVDLDVYHPSREHHGGSTAEPAGVAAPTVLFVGRLDLEKHVEDLVRAAALLRGEHDVVVEVVGDGPCRSSWEALAASLGLGDGVRFLGRVSDAELVAAHARACVFVMPGTAELQSLATLEAMASGLPVVAADAMALPHLVRPGRNGWLYRPGDARYLADRIDDLLDDPGRRARMGRESRLIAQQHDAAATVETFELLYDVARGAIPWYAGPVERRLAASDPCSPV